MKVVSNSLLSWNKPSLKKKIKAIKKIKKQLPVRLKSCFDVPFCVSLPKSLKKSAIYRHANQDKVADLYINLSLKQKSTELHAAYLYYLAFPDSFNGKNSNLHLYIQNKEKCCFQWKSKIQETEETFI